MNRTILFFFLIIFSNQTAHSQLRGQKRLDSLLHQLPQLKNDTGRVNHLVDISFTYHTVDPDKGIKYGQQALMLSKKLNWDKGKANAYNRLGVNHDMKGDYPQALEYYFTALNLMKKLNNKIGIANVLSNIGIVYLELGDRPKGLEYYLEALKVYEEIGDKSGIANVTGNMARIYLDNSELPKALEYYSKSLRMFKTLGDSSGMARNLGNIGIVYKEQKKYRQALEYEFKALELYERIGNDHGVTVNLGNIGIVYQLNGDYLKALEYYNRALILKRKAGDANGIAIDLFNIGGTYLAMAKNADNSGNKTIINTKEENLRMAKIYTDSSSRIRMQIRDIAGMMDNYKQLSAIQKMQNNYQAAFESYQNYVLFKDSVFSKDKEKKLTQISMQYEFDKKEATAKAEQEKKDIKQRNIRNIIGGGLLIAVIFLLFVYRQRNRISKEKKLSDELLLNILPSEVAQELKIFGKTKAKHFEQVTVLFTDFKGFTAIAERLSPKELVEEIDECFREFDAIMQKHNIEKIKTIGDAYMAAGGLPVVNNTNARDVVNAALEIQYFMEALKIKKAAKGKECFAIRIGVHTGPVVAGIVGIKKFAYDIWGDTVNTASRMESSGEPGRVNISGATYQIVKENFNCSHRGKIAAKNKGEIDMYFVNGNVE